MKNQCAQKILLWARHPIITKGSATVAEELGIAIQMAQLN